MSADMENGAINEINRQLKCKSSIECVGPPHVILNGVILLKEFSALTERCEKLERVFAAAKEYDEAEKTEWNTQRRAKSRIELKRAIEAVESKEV